MKDIEEVHDKIINLLYKETAKLSDVEYLEVINLVIITLSNIKGKIS